MKQPECVQEACGMLISRVLFERATLHFPGDSSHEGAEETTRNIKEATRLYMQTWVIPYIIGIRDGNLGALKCLLAHDTPGTVPEEYKRKPIEEA